MSAATKEDTRNTAWRSNNVGSRLLQKMGWKDGQAVGKRQQEQQTGAESVKVSGEGLRVIKRQDGLGLGAQQTGLLAPSAQPHHVQQFSDVLSNLQQSHKSSSRRSKKKRAAASSAAAAAAVILPTNKSTHQQVRQAKFSEKTDEDMKCIFGGGLPDFPVIATTDDIDGDKKPQNKKKKKKRKKSKRRGESQLQSDEDRKRSRKKRKKEKEL